MVQEELDAQGKADSAVLLKVNDVKNGEGCVLRRYCLSLPYDSPIK